MPNWCYTSACFKGKQENLQELYNDIKLAEQYEKDNNYRYLNLWYFFSLKGLNVEHYLYRYKSIWSRPNFRGSIHSSIISKVEPNTLYVYLDTAWSMSYDILRLILHLYNLDAFSAYSEEPNMDYFAKCNHNDYTYNYDIAIRPDWEELENAGIEDNVELAGKIEDTDIINTFKLLSSNNISYDVVDIPEDDYTNLFGIYYHPIRGVLYPGVIYE